MNLQSKNKINTSFSLSSMTDIVFLLLIFFLITGNTSKVLDLLLPKAEGTSTKIQNTSVNIDKDLNFYINDKRVRIELFERELKIILKGMELPTIVLRAEETVPINKVVYVMDIASRNNYKVILAVRPK